MIDKKNVLNGKRDAEKAAKMMNKLGVDRVKALAAKLHIKLKEIRDTDVYEEEKEDD